MIAAARRGSGLSQRELAQRAGTSQPTLSAYERGVKSPGLDVPTHPGRGRLRDDTVTHVHFERREAPRVRPFWVPDRLWRGVLPECFTTIVLQDPARFRGVQHWDLRYRPPAVLRDAAASGEPAQLRDWIDGALLVDLWKELQSHLSSATPGSPRWISRARVRSHGPGTGPCGGYRSIPGAQ